MWTTSRLQLTDIFYGGKKAENSWNLLHSRVFKWRVVHLHLRTFEDSEQCCHMFCGKYANVVFDPLFKGGAQCQEPLPS